MINAFSVRASIEDLRAAEARYSAPRVGRARMIWQCKRCKTVKAYDYRTETRLSYVDPVMLNPKWGPQSITRTDDAGRTLDYSHDAKCPGCGNHRTTARVKGVRNDHKCDARCVNSKGPNCECSCGGENHGKSHL